MGEGVWKDSGHFFEQLLQKFVQIRFGRIHGSVKPGGFPVVIAFGQQTRMTQFPRLGVAYNVLKR